MAESLDPVTQYAADVVEGRVVAGRLVRLACQRHINDLARAAEKGLVWKPAEAQAVIDFYAEVLCLPEETAAEETVDDEVDPEDGSPFVLRPWQQFMVGSLMGWYTASGYRRFRDAYVEVAKGAGKALALDTPIPTPDGWTTMGAIQTGDRVFDEKGRIVDVLATSAVMVDHSCYEVVFDDGSIIVADEEHLWFTESGSSGSGVRTTLAIRETLYCSDGSVNHRIPMYGGREGFRPAHGIIEVIPVASVPVKCIAVNSPSHLYLAGESMIPTHNTPLGAGLMLYLLVADGERGAQIFFAAVGLDQAKLGFADASKMVQASPALRALVDQKVNNLAVLETGSFLRPISSEKRGLDGKRVHGALIDEEHEHPTGVVVSKVRRGTKGRRNALVVRTTNSGFDRTSICWHDHEYSRKVLEGTLVDETWFAYVCGMDPCPACLDKGKSFPSDDCSSCDDWRTEGPHWLKACPNLGVSVSWQYYRDLVKQAKARPDAVSDLLRFNFCAWTQSETRAISMNAWSACQPFPNESELLGAPCYGGLDLGQSDDFSAWARVWALADGRVAVKMRFWVPKSALAKYPDRSYGEWKRAGVLTVTEGNTTDYGLVQATVAEDCQTSLVRDVAYDNRFAEQMAQNLQGDGVTMVPTGQGFQLNEAIRRMLELIVDRKLCHGSNQILSWMAGNFVLRHGTKGDVRADKESSADKIDGVVAACMGIDRLVRAGNARQAQFQMLILGK